MKSGKRIDDTPARIRISTRLPGDVLLGNPAINRNWQNLHRGRVDSSVCSSRTIESLGLAIGKKIIHDSGVMAWDNQRIFGPAPQNGNSSEKVALEAD